MRCLNLISPFVAATLLLAPASAMADGWCAAVPTAVLTNKDGTVMANMPWRQGWVGICNVRVSWKGVDPSVCWNWYSQIATAVTNNKTTVIYYNELKTLTSSFKRKAKNRRKEHSADLRG